LRPIGEDHPNPHVAKGNLHSLPEIISRKDWAIADLGDPDISDAAGAVLCFAADGLFQIGGADLKNAARRRRHVAADGSFCRGTFLVSSLWGSIPAPSSIRSLTGITLRV
jgi:hypothetical protein